MILNGLILYQSKYGASARYAKWLSEKTGFEKVDMKEEYPDLGQINTLIYCAGVYAGGISGLSAFCKAHPQLSRMHFSVLAVGASSYNQTAVDTLKAASLKGNFKDVPLFYARGIWDLHAMTLKDRTLCRMLQKMVARKKPEEIEPWMADLLSAGDQAMDWTDPVYLEPVLQWVQKEPI